jgi:hypothetical protein
MHYVFHVSACHQMGSIVLNVVGNPLSTLNITDISLRPVTKIDEVFLG